MILNLILMVLGRRRPKGDNDTDEALMERFRQGDARAFERLLSKHEKGVYNFIYRMMRHEETANDLLQETFLRVVKNAQRYSPKAKFTTWLYTIARNQCIDAMRRAKHRRHRSLDQKMGRDADGPTLMDKLPGRSADGFSRTDAREMTVRIEAAVEQLSDEQREVFVMRQFRNLKFKEIAEVIGVSENTIKSRMRYALENLRLVLADYKPELERAGMAR